MFLWWLMVRYFKTQRGLLSLSTSLSLVGMTIGVASLVVAMAVVSGFESTLKRSVIDTFGHLVVFAKKGEDRPEEFRKLQGILPEAKAFTPFLVIEALLAQKGKTSGVVVYGVDEATVEQVVRLHSRLVRGHFRFHVQDGLEGAVIGKGLAKKHNLNVGDSFRVALPQGSGGGNKAVRSRVLQLRVQGVLDLGRHDFDSRYVMVSLTGLQDFAQLGHKISGYRFRLQTPEQAEKAVRRIDQKMQSFYEASTWRDVNRYLFEAVELEKPVIFFVLLIIVVAASFNIASTLFVNVVRRYRDISVLKAMGAGRGVILGMFSLHGTFIGALGAFAGLVFGLLACMAFVWLQNEFGLINGEVYKLDRVEIELRFIDLFAIVGASLFISFLASLGPAWRGANLPPVEGLRYE